MGVRLRITGVERIRLSVPFTPRTQPWNALLVGQWRIVEVLRVSTDAPGLIGYGETLPAYTWGRVSDAAIARVIGANPADLLADDTLGCGLQMALYDLVGKALEVPVHRLLGQPKVRNWCPLAWWNTKMPPELLAAEAQEASAQGYTDHKIKARPWFDVYAQVAAISEVTAPTYRIELDWNSMLLDAGHASPVLAELALSHRVSLFEEPIARQDLGGNRVLRRGAGRPIALHLNPQTFAAEVGSTGNDACDSYVVAWQGIGGLLQMGALCAAFNKPFFLQMVGTGLTTALCVQLGAVLPLARLPAITCMNVFADDLLLAPLTICGGMVRVPDEPGLGVMVDAEALERYRVEPEYRVDDPPQILSVVWPGRAIVHYADMQQCWADVLAGNQPVQEPGVRLELWPADGSEEWVQLRARLQNGPVRDEWRPYALR